MTESLQHEREYQARPAPTIYDQVCPWDTGAAATDTLDPGPREYELEWSPFGHGRMFRGWGKRWDQEPKAQHLEPHP